MKKITLSAIIIFKLLLLCNNSFAQNIFPANGRAGIYTTSPPASLQVRGGARIGTTANYVNIDSATGNLSFVGTSHIESREINTHFNIREIPIMVSSLIQQTCSMNSAMAVLFLFLLLMQIRVIVYLMVHLK